MDIKNARKQRANDVFDDQSTKQSKSTLSNELTNLSIYDISLNLQKSWYDEDPDEIMISLQNIKSVCDEPDQLISTEQFYPAILPILILILHEPDKHQESFPIGSIIIESLSILCDISSSISLEKNFLRDFIKDLYSLLLNNDYHMHVFNSDFQLDDQTFFQLILNILINFIQRDGIYAFTVADLFHLLDFIPFLASIPKGPVQHSAIVFLTTFRDLKMVSTIKNASTIADLIQTGDFTDLDKFHLVSWLLDLVPDSFEAFDPEFLLQFLYLTITDQIDQDPEDVPKNQASALICLKTIINKSKDIDLFESRGLHEFDYTPIFDILMKTDKQNEINEYVFRCSLRCIAEIADIGIKGLEFLASNIDIAFLIQNTLCNYHPITSQKYAVKLIKKIAKHCRDSFVSLFLDEKIIISLISLLNADDNVSMIKDIIKYCSIIIGDTSNQDELSINFYDIFEKNDGWDTVIDLMYNCPNNTVSNIATTFYHNKNKKEISDDDDLDQLI